MPPPNRWENYTPIGDKIKNTRFIAFKVPLKPALCNGLPENQRFTPHLLLEHVKSSGHELKLIIDLTNTAKYYHPQDLIKNGIKYKKFYTVGHSVPNATVVRLFTGEVDDFLAKNENSESLIGVHCTHGVNRTGYLICRYMIDKMGFTPEDAIAAFTEARGHQIERENYIRNLKGSDSAPEDGFDEGNAPLTDHGFYQNRREQFYDNVDYSNNEYSNRRHYSNPYSNSGVYNEEQGYYNQGYEPYGRTRNGQYYNMSQYFNCYYDDRYSIDEYNNNGYSNGVAHGNICDSGRYRHSNRCNKWDRYQRSGPMSQNKQAKRGYHGHISRNGPY